MREYGARERSPVCPVLHQRVEDIAVVVVAIPPVTKEVFFRQAVWCCFLDKPEFWGDMVQQGSWVVRLPDEREAAVELLMELAW